MALLWMAYLLADWIAIFVIGLILRAEQRDDILVFWAPFLLLHLGGPDTITSFSLWDNGFWIRHLLQLILQVGSTAYVIGRSLPHNKLLLPTLLVLAAGIIKYAERNRAFYLACLDNYGDRVTNQSLHRKTAVKADKKDDDSKLLEELTPYGTIKNLLVGPLIPHKRRDFCRRSFLNKKPKEVLGIIEFELSLLYEALHTKLPVVDCKLGYIRRFICIGCISGALLSFRLITKAKQYRDELENSEIWLTYGLLIGAITLDFISIGLLISSDYFNAAKYGLGAMHQNDTIMAWIRNRLINRHRWSKRIPQLNFITYCLKAYPDWLNELDKYLPVRFILKFIQGIRCMSSEVLKEQVLWNFIFEQVKGKAELAETVEMGNKICLKRGDGILDEHSNKNLIWSVKDLDYMESLLTWHIATELCLQDKSHQSASSPGNSDFQTITKLLSKYMFYLLQEETAIRDINSVSIGWKKVFNHTHKHMQNFYLKQGKKDVAKRMISTNPGSKPPGCPPRSVLCKAHKLFNELKESDDKGFPWELMSKVWVELMCYAAIHCKPHAHAQQPSMGGQLITIVWLLMNHCGLGNQFATNERAVDDDEETDVVIQCTVDDDEETNVVIQCTVDDDEETNVVIQCAVDDNEKTNVVIQCAVDDDGRDKW
ncbi:hypothetical protein SLEP1_g27133 [Rubroshorea leprosula]|uniref:DUF4220 domain-containing protein n=1 Tax=Rubroshorea leprosula TaxID=152421 RepID=A0AAV5K0R6_9ROSI|nr:hypothetical protein SLEP1_g27133 [Rubroshorea leprosula]